MNIYGLGIPSFGGKEEYYIYYMLMCGDTSIFTCCQTSGLSILRNRNPRLMIWCTAQPVFRILQYQPFVLCFPILAGMKCNCGKKKSKSLCYAFGHRFEHAETLSVQRDGSC